MKTLIFMVAILLIASSAFAYNINEIRICDTQGDCVDVSSSGNLILS